MKIQIDLELLRKNSLFIATPMYGGQCSAIYCRSVSDLRGLCAQANITAQTNFLCNESLIPRARNLLCDEFMRSDCTHLMFIDADIGFVDKDVLAMMYVGATSSDYGILAGVYPMKVIPTKLCFNPINKNKISDDTFAVEVKETGTGFMMIKREALERLSTIVPKYKTDRVGQRSREISQFFQAEIVGDRYLSEDFWFCHKAREVDIKTWVCPWVKLRHAGTHIYSGSLMD